MTCISDVNYKSDMGFTFLLQMCVIISANEYRTMVSFCIAVIMTPLIVIRKVRNTWSRQSLWTCHQSCHVSSLIFPSHCAGYYTHIQSLTESCLKWTERTGEASSCCFSWSLHCSVVHMSKSCSDCVNMERFDLYGVTEPSGPPALIAIQVVGSISMKYVCHSCWCCTETLENIK